MPTKQYSPKDHVRQVIVENKPKRTLERIMDQGVNLSARCLAVTILDKILSDEDASHLSHDTRAVLQGLRKVAWNESCNSLKLPPPHYTLIDRIDYSKTGVLDAATRLYHVLRSRPRPNLDEETSLLIDLIFTLVAADANAANRPRDLTLFLAIIQRLYPPIHDSEEEYDDVLMGSPPRSAFRNSLQTPSPSRRPITPAFAQPLHRSTVPQDSSIYHKAHLLAMTLQRTNIEIVTDVMRITDEKLNHRVQASSVQNRLAEGMALYITEDLSFLEQQGFRRCASHPLASVMILARSSRAPHIYPGPSDDERELVKFLDKTLWEWARSPEGMDLDYICWIVYWIDVLCHGEREWFFSAADILARIRRVEE